MSQPHDGSGAIESEKIGEYLAFAQGLVKFSRPIVSDLRHAGMRRDLKADRSPVTEIDIGIERVFRQAIGERYPAHGVIGEEFGASNADSPFQWVLDPIDGTEELVNNLPTFATLAALFYRGEPLVGLIDHPALDLTISAGKGCGAFKNGVRYRREDRAPATPRETRVAISIPAQFQREGDERHVFCAIYERYPNIRIFYSAFGYTCALTGSCDAMVEYNVHLWDLAPARIIAEESGAKYTPLGAGLDLTRTAPYSAIFGERSTVEKIERIVRSARADQ